MDCNTGNVFIPRNQTHTNHNPNHAPHIGSTMKRYYQNAVMTPFDAKNQMQKVLAAPGAGAALGDDSLAPLRPAPVAVPAELDAHTGEQGAQARPRLASAAIKGSNFGFSIPRWKAKVTSSLVLPPNR